MTRWNKIYNYNVDCGCSNGCDNEPCGCKTKLSSLCVIYDNKDLENLGIEKGDNLENILKRIDLIIGNILTALEEQVVISNIGTGEEIYAGTDDDGVNLVKTVLGGDGIKLEPTKEELIIKVDDEYIDNKLEPLKEEIDNQSKKLDKIDATVSANSKEIASNKKKGEDNSHEIDQLEERMLDVEECCSTNRTDIKNIQKNVSNLSDKYDKKISDLQKDLSSEIKKVSDKVDVNTSTINTLVTNVDNLENLLKEVTVVYMEESIGQTIIQLKHPAQEILRVNYCGAVLPKSGWVFQNGNQVALQVSQYGLSVEPTDVIQVEYKTKIK